VEVRVVLVREMSAIRQGKEGQQAGDLRVDERRRQDVGRMRELDDRPELQTGQAASVVHYHLSRLSAMPAATAAYGEGARREEGSCADYDCGSRGGGEELGVPHG
jgi:hypothetical protein